jgi:hypothetical protein
MDRNSFFIFLSIFLIGCGSAKTEHAPAAKYVVYTDSSVVLKYDISSPQKDTIVSLNGKDVSNLIKLNDSMVSVSVRGGDAYCIKDLISLETTNHYTHEQFFDLLDSYADDSLFFIIDTTHYYTINVNNGKVMRYRTDMLMWVLSQVPIAGWTGLPIHPNVPEEGYHMTNCFYDSNGDTVFFNSYTLNRPEYPKDEQYFIESDFFNGRKVITSQGNLILKTNWRTDTLIRNLRKQWRYWTGDGAYDPSLRYDGSSVVFRCLNGQHRNFADGRVAIGDSGIYELNINTRDIRLVIDRHYENPEYSPDGKFLLLWQEDAYLHNYSFHTYNLKTKELITIGVGNNCIWF